MRAQLHSEPWTLQQATADRRSCRRLLDTHGQVWVSLLWGHCPFLLGPGVHKVLFVPSKRLFPQPCASSGSFMMGLLVTSSERAYAIPSSAAPRAPALAAVHCNLYHAGDSQTQFWLSLCGVSRSWCTQGLFEPSEHLWQVWGLILNAISHLLPSYWGSPLPLDMGYLFLVGSNIPLLTIVQQRVVILKVNNNS